MSLAPHESKTWRNVDNRGFQPRLPFSSGDTLNPKGGSRLQNRRSFGTVVYNWFSWTSLHAIPGVEVGRLCQGPPPSHRRPLEPRSAGAASSSPSRPLERVELSRCPGAETQDPTMPGF